MLPSAAGALKPAVSIRPTMYRTLLGLLAGPHGGGRASSYLLATYGVFGVMAPGLFGFGVSIAIQNASNE